ncbi:MAG TPA: type II toxin-antitoxin system antitoxin SocA domain-containing protein, partial [Thermoanaerobaculia bacterium]|nr:type II toxin-antitoxin system antitoxin SocA domain-containing protein [Thermoanaerobaculia bacterium]
AWPYGPVIPSLYHRFKSYGADPITDLVYVPGPTGELYPPLPTDTDTLSVLNKVWQQYGRYSAVQLTNLSHAPGSPWAQAWGQGEQSGIPIDNGVIHSYFLKTARSRQAT